MKHCPRCSEPIRVADYCESCDCTVLPVEFAKAEIAVVNVQPGDTVVVMYPDPLSADDAQRLYEQIGDRFGPNVVVMDNGARIGVLRHAA